LYFNSHARTHYISFSHIYILCIFHYIYTIHSGPNRGTSDEVNKIVFVQKPTGGPNNYNGESTKVHALSVAQFYQINNYRDSQYNVMITYVEGTTDLRDATIMVRTIDLSTPVIACDGNKRQFTLIIRTDDYGTETYWSLKEASSDNAIASVQNGIYTSNTEYIIDYRTPGYEDTFCLTPGSTYTLEVYDSYGDGMCCSYGPGFFSGLVDGEEMSSKGGAFGTSIIKTFTVADDPNNVPTTDSRTTSVPSESPTSVPSESPTSSPTSIVCDEAQEVRFKLALGIDSWGEETKWSIKQEQEEISTIIATKGGLAAPSEYKSNTEYDEYVCLQKNECYNFIIEDGWGDGICCK
jgi:hypothetical protein